jgi:hypothetical protein
MLLKRLHNRTGAVTGVLIKHTGTAPEQNFSRAIVLDGLNNGWISLTADELTLSAEPEDLRYALLRTPGYYCKSSSERIPISEHAWSAMLSTGQGIASRAEALAWLAAHGKSQADYEIGMDYRCRLNPEQHAKFKKQGA